MTPDYASLCFLSFNRPKSIYEAVTSAVENAGYPCEVIIHDDGSADRTVQPTLTALLNEGKVSRLVLNHSGINEGVGTAINRMFKLATGHTLIKADQDLVFRPGWLARAVGILEDERVGMLGFFKYEHEPVDWRKMKIEVPTRGGYHYTRQFCGSAFAIPRVVTQALGEFQEHSDAFAEDMDYMCRVRNADLELALPDVDLVDNCGFGYGPSTVCLAPDKVQSIRHEPYVIERTP